MSCLTWAPRALRVSWFCTPVRQLARSTDLAEHSVSLILPTPHPSAWIAELATVHGISGSRGTAPGFVVVCNTLVRVSDGLFDPDLLDEENPFEVDGTPPTCSSILDLAYKTSMRCGSATHSSTLPSHRRTG